jgi:hypothetical protein
MNSPCKLIEFGIAQRTLTNQNLVTYLNGAQTGGGPNYHRIYVDGGIFDHSSGSYVGFDNMSVADPRWPASYSEQIGGDTFNPPTGYCSIANVSPGSSAACWAYSGGWDTLLYHITPGPLGPNSSPPNWFEGPSVCSIQTWAAHEGVTSYTKIRDQTYQLQGWDALGKEGYQAIYLATYSNNLNQPLGFTSRFAQIVFSKQFIPCPQV